MKEFSEHSVLLGGIICDDLVNKYRGVDIYLVSFALNKV